MRRAALMLVALVLAACGAIEDAADDIAERKVDDKPEAVPLTLLPEAPPTSEFQATPSDPVRTYCNAVGAVAAAVEAGGVAAAQEPLQDVASASEGLAAVDLTLQDLQAVTSCTAALQAALNPG